MKFHTVAKIGQKRSLTQEGYLLIEDVPLGRTGEMLYGEKELPLTPDKNGRILIKRTADEVFSLKTMASFNGKPLVNEHPMDDVSPKNWRQLALGTIMNPRRGVGTHDQFLVGDVMVYDKDAIDAIQKGKIELSLGYDADYREISAGLGEQCNIIGNHAALVDRGRCGPRCAFGDHAHDDFVQPKKQERQMASKLSKFKDAILHAFKTQDADALNDALISAEDEGDDDEVHVHVHAAPSIGLPATTRDAAIEEDDETPAWAKTFMTRLDAIEKKVTEGVKTTDAADGEMTGAELQLEVGASKQLDAATKFKDSAMLAESTQEVFALAEILAPGIQMPTFDAALSPKKTIDSLCGLRRSALTIASQRTNTSGLVQGLMPNTEVTVKTADCATVRNVFNAAGAAAKVMNNVTQFRDTSIPVQNGDRQPRVGVQSIDDLNKRNSEFYAHQSAKIKA